MSTPLRNLFWASLASSIRWSVGLFAAAWKAATITIGAMEARLAGKQDIRKASKEAGLPTWNKPAYACLATRILTGEKITEEKLAITENAESILFDMGFRDFRVRMRGNNALCQFTSGQLAEAFRREGEIKGALSELYDEVNIDGSPRISG